MREQFIFCSINNILSKKLSSLLGKRTNNLLEKRQNR